MRRKGKPLVLLVGMQTGAATVGNSLEVAQKVKNKLRYAPAIAPLDIYPEATKIQVRRCTCILMFIAALSAIAKL